MAKNSYYDDDDEDDSYNADWSPDMEQAPVQTQSKPAAAALDSSADMSTSRSGRGHSVANTANSTPQRPPKNVSNGGNQGVSFSLDNLSESGSRGGGGGDKEYKFGNFRPSAAYMSSDFQEAAKATKDYDDEKAAKRAARQSVSAAAAPIDNKKHRVRPYRCFSEPTYMTEDEIYADMMKPSTTAAFLKSHFPPSTSKIPGELHLSDHIRSMYDSPEVDGRIGSVRVEVLGAVGLARQKPYCAVYLVSGDCAFCTDVLNNFRSPMWPAACTRAAVFPVHHAYARVFVGLFDVKKRQNKDNDVFLGRVVIDIAQLRPNTEYDITFPMRASSFVYDRRKRGVIRLRFSLHWFSERAAICSYLKSSRWFSQSEPTRGLGQPTIPCAEPKTFRNIAVTCHGQDFPGKYTRMAFRATMREFNLYHINMRFLLKTIILDALLYERPHISLYLFFAFMHCIYANIVRMVPPYYFGYIILLFLDNYRHFNISEKFTLGYKPLTVQEIMMGLIKDGKSDKPNFKAMEIKKRAKKRATKNKTQAEPAADSYFTSTFGNISPYTTFSSLMGVGEEEEQMDEGEIEPRDHREFPFSERDEYPKFSVQEALAPSTKAPLKGEDGTQRLAGRLSIYFVKEEEKEEQEGEKEDEDEDEDEDEEQEEDEDTDSDDDDDDDNEEDVENAGDIQVEDVETYDMELEPEEDEVRQSGGAGLFDVGSSKMKRARVRVGPPQNCDISSKKKTPPQQTLQKLEKQFHKLSKGIALERVITVPGARKYGPEPGEDEKKGKSKKSTKEDVLAKRSHYDEFDKILGLQSKTANPVLRITSSFLGPLMRILRILLCAVRVSFNMATWRDPYFSFWILCFLVTMTIVLLIFPWRPFLFIASFLCLGPQNIAVRKYLEKKAAEKAMEKAHNVRDDTADLAFAPPTNENKIEPVDTVGGVDEKADPAMDQNGNGSQARAIQQGGSNADLGVSFANQPKSQKPAKKAKSSGLLGKFKSTKKLEKMSEEMFSFDTEVVDNIEQRPAFSTGHNSRTSKKTRPREVAVPYSKLRKDRFFDWPPDPTVSRATPLPGPWLAPPSSEAGDDGTLNGIPGQELNPYSPIPQSIPEATNGLSPEMENLRRRYVDSGLPRQP